MDRLDYDKLIQDALRDVVRAALKQVEENGGVLPANHHFYLTFQSNRADVIIPKRLQEQHTNEITIVLQHQFWDLVVDDTAFHVTLSFNNVRERLTVPFSALISFMDPSVKFGLQFIPLEEHSEATSPTPSTVSAVPDNNTDDSSTKSSKKDKIVALDAFRKKK